MFHIWEGLSILDGVYFCFITLSTIGFGDILPEKTLSSMANENETESKKRIIIIVLYILGGMTLVAMSFNLSKYYYNEAF
ncbi:potassium channel subfamily K-like protein [Euroglyphus maynei]|uniref:Potassium channel subfamily K-like protein n=1 Tax=Euroglyphus maynei TaxID=6958 RepID=A0A1Y3ARV9_EURMA|nr:potassium channel subfamily K-like protein [Euroglyphus maynei]